MKYQELLYKALTVLGLLGVDLRSPDLAWDIFEAFFQLARNTSTTSTTSISVLVDANIELMTLKMSISLFLCTHTSVTSIDHTHEAATENVGRRSPRIDRSRMSCSGCNALPMHARIGHQLAVTPLCVAERDEHGSLLPSPFSVVALACTACTFLFWCILSACTIVTHSPTASVPLEISA